MSKRTKTKLGVMAGLAAVGGAHFAAAWIRGEHGRAVVSLLLVVVIALLLLLAGRSEALREQLFDSDERSGAIGLFTAAWAGFGLLLMTFAIYLIEFARGHSAESYSWMIRLYVALFILVGLVRSFRR